MARISGKTSVARTFLNEYCPWVWVGDSISVNLYRGFLKAFKPAHLSGIGTSVNSEIASFGSVGNISGLSVEHNGVGPRGGSPTMLVDYYSYNSVTEYQIIDQTVVSAPSNNVQNRLGTYLLASGNDWRTLTPFTEIASGGGTWRLIYVQHATAPQDLLVATIAPTTNEITQSVGGNVLYDGINFREDGVRKITFQDFAANASNAGGAVYDGTALPRATIQVPGGFYDSGTDDTLAVFEAEFFQDRAGSIPHFVAQGGWHLSDYLNPAYSFGDPWVQYLQAIDCKVVSIMIGHNGFNFDAGYDAAGFPVKLTQFMTKCKEANPAMQFILWGYPYVPDNALDYTSALMVALNAATEAAVDPNNCLYLDLGLEIGTAYVTDTMLSDHTHPSSASTVPTGFGTYEIGRAMMQLLRDAAGQAEGASTPIDIVGLNTLISDYTTGVFRLGGDQDYNNVGQSTPLPPTINQVKVQAEVG